jgi:hypothetical protein
MENVLFIKLDDTLALDWMKRRNCEIVTGTSVFAWLPAKNGH